GAPCRTTSMYARRVVARLCAPRLRRPATRARNARSYVARLRGVAGGRAGAGLGGLDLAVLRRRGRHQIVDQLLRRCPSRLHRALERRRIRLRGLRGAADLAHVLQRGVVDLFTRGGWGEIVELADIATHEPDRRALLQIVRGGSRALLRIVRGRRSVAELGQREHRAVRRAALLEQAEGDERHEGLEQGRILLRRVEDVEQAGVWRWGRAP